MFELPKAIITDQTPNKMLFQAAQDAAERQQQMEQLIRRDEQVRTEAFGGAQKQLFDISTAKNIPAEVQKNLLQGGLTQLTALYKDRKGVRSNEISMMASDVLMKAKTDSQAYADYITAGEKYIADMKQAGYNEMNLRTVLSNNLYKEQQVQVPGTNQVQTVRSIKAPTELSDPLNYLNEELTMNPQKYLDRATSSQRLDKILGDYKPAEMKFSSVSDPTGTTTTKVGYVTQSYPFTREQVEIDPVTKQKYKINVLDTEPLTDAKGNKVTNPDGSDVQILSTKAFNWFATQPDPLLRSEVDVMGRDAIDAHNRGLGFNPQSLTPQNIGAAVQQGAIDPFDANNRVIYSRLAMTKKLMPQFGKFGDVDVTVDKAKPVTVRVSGGGGSGDIYTRTGTVKPEAKFPTAWAQMLNQDADVMNVSDPVSFTVNGKVIAGKRVGDRAQGQLVKDNGKKATVVSVPGEVGTIYVVEVDKDNELTDNVIKLSGQQAIDYGSRISSSNGSDIKTFNSLYSAATKTVKPITKVDIDNAASQVEEQRARQAGEDFLAARSRIDSMEDGDSITVDNALVNIDGKPVKIKKITREDTSWYEDSPITVTLSNGSTMKFKNKAAFLKSLK
jgi:hypothetical protein